MERPDLRAERRQPPPVRQCQRLVRPKCQTPRCGHLVPRDPSGPGARRSRLRRGPEHRERRSNRGDHRKLPASPGRLTREGAETWCHGQCRPLSESDAPRPLRGARSSCPVPVPGARHLVADTSRRTLVASAPISPDAARFSVRRSGTPPASPGQPCDFARQAGPTVLRRTTPLVFRSESWQRSSLFGGCPRCLGREQTTRRPHDSFAATCSVRLRPPRAPLWETWGKHRASGFPEWFQRVPSCSFRRACGETSDFWNAAGGEPRARAASHPRPG